jgi:pimeloyl-ACP methyl ester carboxylesterase
LPAGGAPYATACAALLPHRTAALLLLVPFAQLGGRAALAATLTPRNLKNLELASQRPWLMRLLLGAVRLVQQVPHGTALLHFGGFAPVDLAAVGAHPAQVARLKRASWEGTRPGICGALRDMQVMGAAPGAALAAVACRAVVWAGDEDATTPLAMARAYGDGIRGAEVRVVEGQGHFLSFRHGREVLASALV